MYAKLIFILFSVILNILGNKLDILGNLSLSPLHPFFVLVVVSSEAPEGWEKICSLYRDVYFLRGEIVDSATYNNANIKYAYALVSLAKKAAENKSSDDNIDSDTLFAFLKLEIHIPSTVFFTVELVCPPNLAVLNSTVIKRSKANIEMAKIKRRMQEKVGATGSAPVGTSMRRQTPKTSTQGTFMLKRRQTKAVNIPPLVVEEKVLEIKKDKNENKASDDAMTKRKVLLQAQNAGSKAAVSFWDASNSHHILPVFASGIAFVPASYDTILCQSFYNTLIPIIVETMVCGQGSKTIFLIKLPPNYIGRTFRDIFRAFNSRNIIILGIYRAPYPDDLSVLPFAYGCPKPDSVMRADDSIYVIANPFNLRKSLISLELPFVQGITEDTFVLGNLGT